MCQATRMEGEGYEVNGGGSKSVRRGSLVRRAAGLGRAGTEFFTEV